MIAKTKAIRTIRRGFRCIVDSFVVFSLVAVFLLFLTSGAQYAKAQSVPAKPDHFTVGVSGLGFNGQAQLNWRNPNNPNITKYQVRHKAGTSFTSLDSWVDIPGSGSSTRNHLITNLTFGTTYAFQVRAVNGNVSGAASDVLTAAPTPLPGPNAAGRFVHPPTNVTLGLSGFDKISVSWDWDDPICSTVSGEPYIYELSTGRLRGE